LDAHTLCCQVTQSSATAQDRSKGLVGKKQKRLLVLLGNQLFSNELIARAKPSLVFMAESERMCRRYRVHTQKLVFILSAMRSKADALKQEGHAVAYTRLEDARGQSFSAILEEHLIEHSYEELVHFETESREMESRLESIAKAHDMARGTFESPMFLTGRAAFEEYRENHKRLFMADFYRWQRKRMNVMVDPDGNPTGGQWSYDEENRKKLPKDLEPPPLPTASWTKHTHDVVELVAAEFSDHPGDPSELWLPTTEPQAEAALRAFLDERFELFGDYEDALSKEHAFLFHSTLSPLLNVGLLTPARVLGLALEKAEHDGVRLNSLEGFVRQIIGWREFIRGVWHALPADHWEQNFWNHTRRLTDDWYEGTTGVPPLDDAIRRAGSHGYNHHIERLMVLGNMMLLCRVEPRQAYDWFMEMFVDSADWVMAPNVYGMALHSEGGAFTTKPYICGSNYLRKMSDYPKGDWCDVVDGLYWAFVRDHRDFFEANPRSKMMTRTLDRLADDRKEHIFALADSFIERVTR
jgi:deoxyribodipyrimidine photolyase-related protein